MIAGIRIRNSFIRTMITKPIMTRMISKGMFNDPSPKLLRIEHIVGSKIEKFMSLPQ